MIKLTVFKIKMNLCLSKLPIRLLIIVSRTNKYYHNICFQLLSLKSVKKFLLAFTKIDKIQYFGRLHDNLSLNYLCHNYNIHYNSILNQYQLTIGKNNFYILDNKIVSPVRHHLKKIFNTPYEPIQNIQIKNIYIHYSFYNFSYINHRVIYKFLIEHFSIDYIYIKSSTDDIDQTLIYNELNFLPSKFRISISSIKIRVHKYKITCYSKGSTYIGLWLDYQFIANLIQDALFYNNIYYITTFNNIRLFQEYIANYRFYNFTKKYLQEYLVNLDKYSFLKHIDHYFNYLAIHPKVKLNNYYQMNYIKYKLFYRLWLITHIPIDYDNILDICQIYIIEKK